MKKIIVLSALAAISGGAFAQDTYQAAALSASDLNGTARYVGMGGALGALGGDISTMSNNPAGTALFRRSDISFTCGGVFSGESAMGHDASRASIDNAGVVFAFDAGDGTGTGLTAVNFGVNYVKKRNFLGNANTSLANLNGLSQTFQIADMANDSWYYNDYGMLTDLTTSYYDKERPQYSHDGILVEEDVPDKDGNIYRSYYGVPADKANYRRATYGGVSQVDLNLSANVSDRFFYGLSIGIYDMNYNRESFYEELGADGDFYDISSWYRTQGSGVDVKFGMICRPFEDSGFRFGLMVHTPTWYSMEDYNGAEVYYNDEYLSSDTYEPYQYNFRTPWKLGFSLGHTIGNMFAIGAEYEFQDMSSVKYSTADFDASNYFMSVNQANKDCLRAQHTVKLGLEIKPTDAFSIRAGYNFVSSPYHMDAYRTLSYSGPYTETDFTNWKGINRFTCGLGYRFRGGYFDVTYQYQAQEGDFYAFDHPDLKPAVVSANRSQLLCTLGFRF